MSVYEKIGVRPVVNACGIYTDLGGSTLSPTVWRALTEANTSWASLPELLEASGRRIAELCSAEAARVVPGASAGIALSVAACIARGDGAVNEALPQGGAVERRVLMQSPHRYKYARCALLAGADIVEAAPDRLVDLIGDGAAAVLHPAHLDGHDGSLSLQDVADLARARNVPVVVDAAYLSFPTELIGSFTKQGADLVCFSAKYFYGPNAGGFLLGRKDLIEFVEQVDFTHYEGGPWLNFGRPFKLDRTAVVGTLLALEEWLSADHKTRWASYAQRVEQARAVLESTGARTRAQQFTLDERLVDEAPNAVVVELDPGQAQSVETALADGEPRILCVREAGRLVFCVETIPPEQDVAVFSRIRDVLKHA